ncbi:5-formyltetrahydrofolate cyclo-ligase [Desulfatibacillum aliphaticivorans]|uniref:5-formyltetrahydrofolate cyclo-ligase n=1 Tax=Desulfatibacillum aliphaticivorans TaxID=218208 RepID=B8FNA5_DESAL|nr:5-formyltetrahydrofolate cyclo-ligase [Desulfatibacillum aliphaticivorans]ACL06074.1 5-formyltetrahydrofolate cyclo-ligase [Desulfatibacillum aliphaticivorans]
MEDVRIKKREVRTQILNIREGMDSVEYEKKSSAIQESLLDFANFQESKTILLYSPFRKEPDSTGVIKESFSMGKVVLLPVVHPKRQEFITFKIDNLEGDMRDGSGGKREPDPKICKPVPLRFIELAIIPGVAFDERGGRVGYGEGYYDKLIPLLPATTRKVAIAFENQLVSQVPMEAHDKFVDIIITEERVIYKI